ncbi:facilitated trehalose transporter Tret1-1-like [Pectinophora gossypiella]|uniref:facilitated trehalose transporter Tret1-1-like n=1 Tax=Pectinophora gossypiella TaxID=13191 RepID=UPI00214E06B0|nr:facilitated trehalose transporter Tret1-1-like [Pectinophora gossypiella]
MSLVFQALCTSIVCYTSLNMGLIMGWPSCTLKLFESGNTTLHRPMTETELALFGSLSSIGALISTPIAGYLLDVIGRKYCMILSALSYATAWGFIAFTTQVEMILTAIFISGLGASSMLIVRVYVSEFCQETVRGTMTTVSIVFYSTGLMIVYMLGGNLEYKMTVYSCLGISVVGVIILGFLKETPTYFLKRGMPEEAKKSIAFYRRVSVESKKVMQEMEALRRAFNPDLEQVVSPEEEKLKMAEKEEDKSPEKLTFWQFIKTSRSTRVATYLTLAIITLSTFQGLLVVQVYAVPLFEEAVPTMSSIACSVLQAFVTGAAGLIAGYLSDVAGRRPLVIYSSIASGLCCVMLGTQLHLHWAPHWVTAMFLYLFTVTYTLGAGTVAYVLITDVFLPEVKSVLSMFIIQWSWLCCFIILFIFNPLVSIIGLGPVFYMFGAFCLLTAVYSYFYQPETKGLPVDAVQLVLVRRRGEK